MKKILSVCLVLSVLAGAGKVVSAQTEKGSFILGASSSMEFLSQSIKFEREGADRGGYESNTFNVSPGAGFFIANNLAIGVQLSIDRTTDNIDGEKYKETTSLILPFALLYFGKGAMKPFVQAAYGPGWLIKGSEPTITEKLSGYELGGGLAIFFSRNVSFDISIGYGSVFHTTKEVRYQLAGQYEDIEWVKTTKGIGGNLGFSIYL